MGETAQDRFVRRQLLRIVIPERFAHIAMQHAVGISDRRHDPGHQIVLQRKYLFRVKRAVKCFGPQVRAGLRIDQLDSRA
jgi:hypothetical protein